MNYKRKFPGVTHDKWFDTLTEDGLNHPEMYEQEWIFFAVKANKKNINYYDSNHSNKKLLGHITDKDLIIVTKSYKGGITFVNKDDKDDTRISPSEWVYGTTIGKVIGEENRIAGWFRADDLNHERT